MEIEAALKIRDALIVLSVALDIEFQTAAAQICFLDEEKFAILKDASETWVQFDKMNLVDRGKSLGITVNQKRG